MTAKTPTVYLAGPISDGDNPYQWHEAVQNEESSIEWINPFTLHDFPREDAREHIGQIIQTDLEAIRSSDGVLLRRIEGRNLSGASIEAREAYVHDVPVVVWNVADTRVPLFLEGHVDRVHDSMQEAIADIKQTVTIHSHG